MLCEPDGSDDDEKPDMDMPLRDSSEEAVAANTPSASTLVQLPDVFVEVL